MSLLVHPCCGFQTSSDKVHDPGSVDFDVDRAPALKASGFKQSLVHQRISQLGFCYGSARRPSPLKRGPDFFTPGVDLEQSPS